MVLGMQNNIISKSITLSFSLLVATFFFVNPALAQNISDISENMVNSSAGLPGLISGAAYLLGLLFAVLGLLKLKDHVENPSQTPLRTPIIRFLIGGGMFALPMIYAAMLWAINGGETSTLDLTQFTFAGAISGLLGQVSNLFGISTPDINGILASIIRSLSLVPALISGISYLLALVLGVAGLIKIKDHVENPDQTPMREGIVRLLVGGALFGLPTVFEAMATLINGGGNVDIWSGISSIFDTIGFLSSAYSSGDCTSNAHVGKLGGALCNTIVHSGVAPAFLTSLSYLFGLILGVWGILKVRDHVLNPTQTQVWEGFSRFLAGGAFFALPVTVEAIRRTVTPGSSTGLDILSFIGGPAQFNGNPTCPEGSIGPGQAIGQIFGIGDVGGAVDDLLGLGGDAAGSVSGGLDVMMACAMSDIIGPLHSLLNFFTFTAGIILIMIGISRLIKTAQDGARGPGGIGTFMTFLAGGALISYNEFIRAFTSSFFGSGAKLTFAKLSYADDVGGAADHAHMVISAILKFMIIVGLISFVRGIFIVRNVAEGNGQASLMAGMTHMVGGALAVNLGPLLQVVQASLGITQYGIVFSTG